MCNAYFKEREEYVSHVNDSTQIAQLMKLSDIMLQSKYISCVVKQLMLENVRSMTPVPCPGRTGETGASLLRVRNKRGPGRLLGSINRHERDNLRAQHLSLWTLLVTDMVCFPVCTRHMQGMCYSTANTSLSPWDHFWMMPVGYHVKITSKHLHFYREHLMTTEPYHGATWVNKSLLSTEFKRGIFTENCSHSEVWSLSSSISITTTHFSKGRKTSNLSLSAWRYSTRSSDREDFCGNLGGHSAYLIHIYFLHERPHHFQLDLSLLLCIQSIS